MSLNFAADGRHLIGCTDGGKAITIWDAGTGKTVHTIPSPDPPSCFALSPDGRTLFAGGTTSADWRNPAPKAVRAWDLTTGRQVWETDFHPREGDDTPGRSGCTIRGLQLIRGGNAIAVVAADYVPRQPAPGPAGWVRPPAEHTRVRIIPRRADEPEQSYSGSEPRAVAFSPDSRWLVLGMSRVLDLTTNTAHGSGPEYGAAFAAFHPTRPSVAFASSWGVGQYDLEYLRKR